MSVGFTVKFYWFQVGTGDFLHSFFSTIAYNLEDKNWGSKFPTIMNELYSGELKYENIHNAINELDEIRHELSRFSPDKVVWDIEDLSKQPPWEDNISDDITDLSNYFVTSDGEDLIEVLKRALETGIEKKESVKISKL
ncbi:hypothetical protein D6856_00010 [Butyrivibrio sp. XB500-5]|uniref:immunity 70 family protein n=1 Tax=Butyrivibrio sp. XB500-5 TaxID=2364880 RepID=UPI000EA89775|nr:immunity 70 family protein [Butyrivibrio sp. XB500-5]RKM62550.1 hypothetical protein D6856_00010 [Butyrivibrio sp. XB500-5]